jgi:hypothetical protein
MQFYVGQKVECIGQLDVNVPEEKTLGVVCPMVGRVYTVRSVDRRIHYTGTADCIQLVEIINPEIGYWDGSVWAETAFDANAFRPLTDIAVFTDALAAVPVDLVAEPMGVN